MPVIKKPSLKFPTHSDPLKKTSPFPTASLLLLSYSFLLSLSHSLVVLLYKEPGVALCCLAETGLVEDMMNRPHIPAFGSWDYCDDLPITQYFESAMQAGLVRGRPFGEDADFLKVTADTVKPTRHHHHHHLHHHQRKVKKPGERQYQQGQQRKQGKASDVTAQTTPRRPRAAKAVDEDLYKIPPELLYQKPKRKRLLKGLWSGCLGLHCTA